MKTTLKITTNSPEEATVIIQILAEIESATQKHPVWPNDAVSRAAIVAEEAGEVIREANHIREGIGNKQALRTELIQTAGTCIRMINLMDKEKLSLSDNNKLNSVKGKGLAALFNNAADY
jgi:NTP pyrophosphatase (non-canonical NTP hydrolase)